ncbi:ribonuclease HI [Bacteroidetes/Chlorobi group bacterium ChocPot_Mid]|jgi:ribonuclease HI|nr:MAG: ribonuclease HI [Bacteroidetes/Chlorobi group bacterium ChocPot_Mid]
MDKKKKVIIYTDGSSLGNPGPGGWGAVLIYGKYRKEISGGFKLTTNNRMELLAAIEALKALKTDRRSVVQLHTDSSYLVNSLTKGWLEKWQRDKWKKKTKPVPNADLWKQLVRQKNKHNVEFIWVPAHTGIIENERCDKLAKEAAAQDNLPEDKGYVKYGLFDDKGDDDE